jgi:hypothetical protein
MAIEDFNHIKSVITVLDGQRPSRLGYTNAAISATGAAELTALEGHYALGDSSQINSIPTPDLIAIDPLIIDIGFRSQAASLTRLSINHFFGRLGLNLLKLTEKVKLLVTDHLVNRYITPSGNVMENLTIAYAADEITLTKHSSPLAANTPTTASAAITLSPAVYNGNAGVMTGADKKILADLPDFVNVKIAPLLRKAAKPNLMYKRPMGNMITEKWYPQASTDPTYPWQSVCWSSELGLFVAVAQFGPHTRGVMTSPNGINWTLGYTPDQSNFTSVCWSPELGRFVAVGNTGLNGMTSVDGFNWGYINAPSLSWQSVCWSPELGIFVAAASSGIGNRVMTSPDGINWTLRTTPVNNAWQSVCWSPELGLFAAVSYTGTLNQVMTSPNGINWTIRTTPVNNQWMSVCWSPELGLFVAVSASGTLNRVMTSPDGINWTIRTTPVDNGWQSVCWSPELGLFVAVSNNGTLNRVMTSPNGINWTIRTTPVDNGWFSVCWSPELGLFVAVSNNGTLNQVMTSRNMKMILG